MMVLSWPCLCQLWIQDGLSPHSWCQRYNSGRKDRASRKSSLEECEWWATQEADALQQGEGSDCTEDIFSGREKIRKSSEWEGSCPWSGWWGSAKMCAAWMRRTFLACLGLGWWGRLGAMRSPVGQILARLHADLLGKKTKLGHSTLAQLANPLLSVFSCFF